jgi:hypothetical protein
LDGENQPQMRIYSGEDEVWRKPAKVFRLEQHQSQWRILQN